MEIELFTLCDGAFNYNGRLTIIGTYDSILASQFPWNIDLSFALKLFVPKGESGEKTISLQFLSQDGDSFAANLQASVVVPESESAGHIALATTIRGVSFPKPGSYLIRIFENDRIMKEFPFDIMGK